MATASEVRRRFIDFFAQNDHKIVPSSSLVPNNDPTLLFANAGMNQFKNIFTGLETRDYVRAVSSQKCVRAGGKHNDLDNVGHTARHHTFFEMLGNFSFGDYFKEKAILYAWDLLTKNYGLDTSRMLVTVYHEDEEAADLWKKIAGFSDDRIIRIATSDNFWSMGDVGPCGPCSEIFYDHGADIPGGPPGSPDEDGDRFIEIWNLVFMQFEQFPDGRVSLPKPSIDTGMGLERISAVLQGVHDNYDIDLFRNLIEASAHLSNTDPYGSHKISHRVIADHLRSSCFLIADGVTPSNEGRGYVLRRIMRRAMRHAHMLGCKDPHMHKLVGALVAEMGDAFPELFRAQAFLTETLRLEEERFQETLGRGLKLLNDELNKIGDKQSLPGEVAFRLYDTYGFPLDLTQDVLRNDGRSVDVAGFNAAMEKQRSDARAAWVGSGDKGSETIWFDLHENLGATEFLGYQAHEAEGNVGAVIVDGNAVNSAKVGDKVIVVVNQTPFYAESGGQMGDTGSISNDTGLLIEIEDTVAKTGKMHAHMGIVQKGEINVGDTVHLKIDAIRRSSLRANHSATHLLHAALRKLVGDHVTQKGSLVAPDRLRFDYSHSKSLSAAEITAIEEEVNSKIRQNTEVTTKSMTPDAAQKEGAMALFGEKYDDEVRVVSMGLGDHGQDHSYFSIELCGGTHVSRTGDIGLFKIISEVGVAAGVRRIEALTGIGTSRYLANLENMVKSVSQNLKVPEDQILNKIENLQVERKKLEKEVKDLRQSYAQGEGGSSDSETINGVNFLYRILNDIEPKDLKPIVDGMKKQIDSGIVLAISDCDGKASVVIGVTDDLTQIHDAVRYVRIASEAVGGQGGGGRPDMAQAGGSAPQNADKAVEAVRKAIAGIA